MEENRNLFFDEGKAEKQLKIVESLLKKERGFQSKSWEKSKAAILKSMDIYSTNRYYWNLLSGKELVKEKKFNSSIHTLRYQAAQLIGTVLPAVSDNEKKKLSDAFKIIRFNLNELEEQYKLYREMRSQSNWRFNATFDPLFTRRFYRILRLFTATKYQAMQVTGMVIYFLETQAVTSKIRDTQYIESRLAIAKKRVIKGEPGPIYISKATFDLLTKFVLNN